jgi:hypothetical protein
VLWYTGDYNKTKKVKTIVPVQEMPRPPNLVNAAVAKGLASVCPDQRVGDLLADGVDPMNTHQEAVVVCTNHKSSTEHHTLVSKAHREENEAGRNMFRRPSKTFRAW